MADNIQRQIRLTREQDDELRRLAYEQRVSVAEVIRRIINNHLGEEKKKRE
jgi:Ribbon-helix-helix protein, copG family